MNIKKKNLNRKIYKTNRREAEPIVLGEQGFKQC